MTFFANCITFSKKEHILSTQPCQDASGVLIGADYSIAVVADGHGEEEFSRSDKGSKFAVDVSLSTIEQSLLKHGASIYSENEFENLIDSIIANWFDKVYDDLKENPPSEEELNRLKPTNDSNKKDKTRLYGSTLLIVVLTDRMSMLIQIGDGMIVSIDKNGNVDFDPHGFYSETDSNSEFGYTSSLVQDYHRIRRKQITDNIPYSYALYSDGLEKAYNQQNLTQRIPASVVLSQVEGKWYGSVANMMAESTERSGDDSSLAFVLDSRMNLEQLYRKTFRLTSPPIIPTASRIKIKTCYGGYRGNEDYYEESTWELPSGHRYSGVLINGTPSCPIEIHHMPTKHLSYDGEIVDFEPSGEGKISKSNSMVYSGHFEKGELNGKGKEFYQHKVLKFDGCFKNGTYHGEKCKYFRYEHDSSWLQYKGDFKNGI